MVGGVLPPFGKREPSNLVESLIRGKAPEGVKLSLCFKVIHYCWNNYCQNLLEKVGS